MISNKIANNVLEVNEMFQFSIEMTKKKANV